MQKLYLFVYRQGPNILASVVIALTRVPQNFSSGYLITLDHWYIMHLIMDFFRWHDFLWSDGMIMIKERLKRHEYD
jgi:hypothetical protein